MQYSEILSQAIRSVRANSLRAILTLLIIAFGIMALVGILTSIDALLFTMNEERIAQVRDSGRHYLRHILD